MRTGLLKDQAYGALNSQDELFRRILWSTLTVYILVGMGVGFLKVKPPALPDITQLSPRIAKLIIPPKVQPKAIEARPEELPKPETKPEEKEKPEEAQAPEKQEVAAVPPPSPEEIAERQRRRNIEIAMNSGLLRLLKQSEKQPISDTKLEKTFTEIKSISNRPEASKPGLALSASAQPSGGIDEVVSQLEKVLKDSKVIISDKALDSSGGISLPEAARSTGGVALKERKTASVDNPFKIKGFEDGQSPRTPESLAEVVESYKGGISFIYNKALRTNPTLRGTITVEFTIAASGEVIDCKVVSSSMDNSAFEETLVRRILQWRFPAISEGSVAVVYPIVFSVTG